MIVVASPKTSLTDGLQVFWPLYETSGNRAASFTSGTASLTLTDNNTVTSAAGPGAGMVAGSFAAANSEYLSITDKAALSFGDEDFAVAVWARFNSIGGTSYAVLSKGANGTATSEYWIAYSGASSRIRGAVSNGTTQTTVDANAFGLPSANTWYSIVLQHDSANNLNKISVNGGTETTASHAVGSQDGTADFNVGRFAVSGTNYMDGRVAMIGIWRRLLTDAERVALYNSGNGLAWPFIK